MNPSDDSADPLHKQFMVARKIFPLDDRDWSELSAPREGNDLSLVLRRMERIRRLPPHLSSFFDSYSIVIEPFISSTSAPMWGPIVFALQLFIGSELPLLTFSSPHTNLALGAILELFDNISDYLSRLVVPYRALFEEKPVKLALTLIYGDIIKICLHIIATTRMERRRRRLSDMALGVARLLRVVSPSTASNEALPQIPSNQGLISGAVTAVPSLKLLQSEFHRHTQFVADYAVRTTVAPGIAPERSSLPRATNSRAEFTISTMPLDIILEIFSVLRVLGRLTWWSDCSSFASTSRHIRTCCLPVLFRRAYLWLSEEPHCDPGDEILRCFRHCSIYAPPQIRVGPERLSTLLSWLSRMQSLESLTFLCAHTVPFDAVNTVLARLPLLCRVDLMHSPCPLVLASDVFPRHVRHFSFTPQPKIAPPSVVQDPLVFEPPNEEEVATVSTALYSILRQLRGTLESLDVPIWCFPLNRLRGIPWTCLRILSLRGYLPIDRRPTSVIIRLFPHLESLEMEVVRTDLIAWPQYLWVDSEEATFPSQLKHLSLIDVDSTDPIFFRLPADLDSLSIIDTRFRKYGRNFVDPGHDRQYRTWHTHTEIASIVSRNPHAFRSLKYLRISISTGQQSSRSYRNDEGYGPFYHFDFPLDVLYALAAACPQLSRLDLHFQRERFLLPAPEDFADALYPICHTLSTLCIEQPHWNGLPAYSLSYRRSKARQKQWFDFLHSWLTALTQHITALRRGSFGFNPVGQRNFDRWQSFLLRTPSGRSLSDSNPPGFTQWCGYSSSTLHSLIFARHINELTDYDKDFAEGDLDRYFYNEPAENPHLLRYSAWRDC